MKKNFFIKDSWLYLPVFILFINFVYRLIDQSKMLFYFPLDYFNDVSSYMAQLHFLKVCGFLEFCPYWYNGFISFQATPPGWFFFALPLYNLFQDVKIATYFTIVLSFVIAFFVIYFAGKKFGFSKFQRIAFFSFMFMTALSVGSFVRLGRVHELFSWVWFLAFAFLVLYYKDRKFDKFSLLIIPAFSLILFSYESVGVLAALLFLSMFLVKNYRGRIYLVLYFLTSLTLISFWFFPFVKNFFSNSISGQVQNSWIWRFTQDHFFTNVAVTLLPIILFVAFYFYWLSKNKSKKELYFFLPILVLGLLYFFRLTPFVPAFRNIFPDPYLTYFLFFILFFFFSTNPAILNKRFLQVLPFALIILALLSVSINVFHTQKFFVPDRIATEELSPLFSKFYGSFLLFGDYPTTIYPKAVYSYAPIYYNLSTPFGWYPHLKEDKYIKEFSQISINDKCDKFEADLRFFNTTHVIGYTGACDKFDTCGFEFMDNSGNFCLYAVT